VGGGTTPGRSLSGGLFGPDSEAWRLNREAVLLLGAGPRALLLQVAHPLVAAGVDEHSAFRMDPWGRLIATLRSYLTIVYGSTPAARAEIDRLRVIHERIRGAGYSAGDPALSMWVHATLIDSTIVAHDAWIEPLDRSRRAAFYAETRPLGRLFGIPEERLPPDIDAFEAYVAAMLGPSGPVHVSPTARDIAATILRPPLGPLAAVTPGLSALAPAAAAALDRLPAAAYAWLLWPAVGLLPPGVRVEYGIDWGLRERAVAAWLTAAWRAWRPVLPAALRWMPQAIAADRRASLSSSG
jgi:uncharacterized protein (DUF2236 family)